MESSQLLLKSAAVDALHEQRADELAYDALEYFDRETARLLEEADAMIAFLRKTYRPTDPRNKGRRNGPRASSRLRL